ncbi:hypothetical protein [Dendronalium phyllosphericum]|nr:hypothetical protein [Dendronalium phyllosphericum]
MNRAFVEANVFNERILVFSAKFQIWKFSRHKGATSAQSQLGII